MGRNTIGKKPIKQAVMVRIAPGIKIAAEKKATLQEKSLSEYIRGLIEKDLNQ